MTSCWTRPWAGAGLLFVAAYIVILAVNGTRHGLTSVETGAASRVRRGGAARQFL